MQSKSCRETSCESGACDAQPALSDRVADDVLSGLSRDHKRLPPWLFYDDEGSRLYGLITEVPEYYPTRAEREILRVHATAIVECAAAGAPEVFALELGAGTAEKSQLVVSAIARRQPRAAFIPCDVSWAPLALLAERFAEQEPNIVVRPVVGHHDRALGELRELPDLQLAIFLGSSIGNYDGADAVELLAGVRASLRPGAALLLGTDMRKSEAILVPAYDDAAGVTAAFNRNVLARINRELGANFVLASFRHVALWNERASRMEMHLESTRDQRVTIDVLDLEVKFRRGERIHTESSVKYDRPMIDSLLRASGFVREETFADPRGWFAVHVARTAGLTLCT